MTTTDARRKLIEAALSFMETGHTPTTRELTERAGVNIAAVNYHFKSKDNLLAQAIDHAVLGRFQTWVDSELTDAADTAAAARLRRLLRYLVDAHRDLPHICRAQIQNLALKDEPERAAEVLAALLIDLLTELAPEWPDRRRRVAAVSLQASVTFLSLFHPRFTPMTGIPVDSAADRDAYVDALLQNHGLPAGAL